MARTLPPALRPVAGVGLALMIAAIATAWGFQLIGGYVPCALCLEQRIPYYVGIPLGIAGLALVGAAPALGRTLLVAAAVAMLVAAGLGVYHAGAEWQFWLGPNTCGGTGDVTDASTLLQQMESQVFVSCNSAPLRLLGLSFAGWNVVSASGAALLLLFSATRPAHN